MGTPQNKLPEIQKKIVEIITELYEFGEGEGDFKVATWVDKNLKETIIRCGKIYRFREKIVDKSKIIK